MKFTQAVLPLLVIVTIMYVMVNLLLLILFSMTDANLNLDSVLYVILPSVLYVICVWFAIRIMRPDRRKKRKQLWWFSLALVLPIALISLLLVNEVKAKFNEEYWKSNPHKRVEMIDDLLHTYDLDNRHYNEVIARLGEPTKNALFKEEHNIVYYLGNERSLISIDSEWLVITFEDQRVSKYELRTD
ncbi:hypothetical protein MKX78_21375 [Cytobacillus sp. FSL R5-0569]|uniref:hypothetical protein n=1 Tax=Cytobacillus TaxID=2675230 RepID=UPI00278557EE|nr:hypothetical protein [Cytobacillus kochii]MDQ0185790.1 amino acid transporter [Cytobacillus kochii]